MSRLWMLYVFYLSLRTVVAVTLEFFPKPLDPPSTLIWYNTRQPNTTNQFVEQIEQLLMPYRAQFNSGRAPCKDGVSPTDGVVCDVQIDTWGTCVDEAKRYGYDREGGPCIFLRVQKVPGWIPEYYQPSELPNKMPQYIKDNIYRIAEEYGETSDGLKVLWVSCKGYFPADVELIGPLNYQPSIGFPAQYFPYQNHETYLSPLIAVQFKSPMVGIVIGVTCKLWAKNLDDNDGMVQFDLMIDEIVS